MTAACSVAVKVCALHGFPYLSAILFLSRVRHTILHEIIILLYLGKFEFNC